MAAEPVIVEAVRTPIGRRGGALANLHPAYLLGETYRELLGRTGIPADAVEQIVGGTVTHAGERAPTRRSSRRRRRPRRTSRPAKSTSGPARAR
ncbi:Steroid 3-ketoacyl-CoA thiolase OS=Streptomyces alboniger OX=132473 GN=CP975_10450 PE=3 SV=1 [Streptomyces alboniger]